MSNSPDNIRQQVLAQIISTMEQAIQEGRDPYEVAEAAFPGTPFQVLCGAEMEAQDRRTEAWWRQIERTIPLEVIRSAIAGPASEPVPAGARDGHFDEAWAALLAGEA